MAQTEQYIEPGALAEFQNAFANALFDGESHSGTEVTALAAQPAFAVYRNTVMKGCIDALHANYPAVARLVGEEWFFAAAADHVRGSPPALPMLLQYGERFPDFLQAYPPAAELSYLPAVARLDRCWGEAHAALSEPALEASALARLTPDTLAAMVVHPHPAARWAWFDIGPVYTIWSRNREEAGTRHSDAGDTSGVEDQELDWKPEGALLVRPGDAVQWQALDAAGCAFLDACAEGLPLGEAAGAALAVQPDADMSMLMASLLAAGAFRGIDT